jgi:hypothetical protein
MQIIEHGKWENLKYKRSVISAFVERHGGAGKIAIRPMYAREDEKIDIEVTKDEIAMLKYIDGFFKWRGEPPLEIKNQISRYARIFRKEKPGIWFDNGERLLLSGFLYTTIGLNNIKRTVFAIDDADFIFTTFRQRFSTLCGIFPTDDDTTAETFIRVDNWRSLDAERFNKVYAYHLLEQHHYGYIIRAWRSNEGPAEIFVYPTWISRVNKEGDSVYGKREKDRR